jgi:hypothetical protein
MSTASVNWPYSTFHRYVRTGVYPIAWTGSVSETDDDVCGEVVGNAYQTKFGFGTGAGDPYLT